MTRFALKDLPPTMRTQAERQMTATIRTVRDGKTVTSNVIPLKPKRVNKYNAQKVNADGHRFDSKHEYAEYLKLNVRERAGEIEGLRVHVTFALFDPGENCRGEYWGRYTADFVYKENGKTIVADAKSVVTKARRDWKKTRQAMKACYGYDVIEL